MLGKFLNNLDADTIAVLTKFAMRGVRSGNLNEYIKTRLQQVMDDEDNPPPPAGPAPRVSTRVVR